MTNSSARKTSLPADLTPGTLIEFKGASMTETATITHIGELTRFGESPIQVVKAVRVTTSIPDLVGTAVTLYLPARKRVRLVQED